MTFRARAPSSSPLPARAYLLMFMLQWLPVDKVGLVEEARRTALSFSPWAFFISL